MHSRTLIDIELQHIPAVPVLTPSECTRISRVTAN